MKEVTGNVKFFDAEKGFGFVTASIEGSTQDIYFRAEVMDESFHEKLVPAAEVQGVVVNTMRNGELTTRFKRITSVQPVRDFSKQDLTCLGVISRIIPNRGFGFVERLEGPNLALNAYFRIELAEEAGIDPQVGMPVRITMRKHGVDKLSVTSMETSKLIADSVKLLQESGKTIEVGVIKFFDTERGFGFVMIEDEASGEHIDHYVHRSTLKACGLKPEDLQPFDIVNVKTFTDKKGNAKIGWLRPTGENVAPETEVWFEGVLTKYAKKTGKGVVQLEWEDDEPSEHHFDASAITEGLGKGDLKKDSIVLVMIDEDEDDEPVTALRLPFADVEADSVESDDVEAGSIVVELPRKAAEG